MNKQERIERIIAANQDVIQEWFIGQASCEHYDGTCYRLYLDLDDDTLWIHQEDSDQSWQQRDDGSLVRVDRHSGYADIPEDERYTDDCDLADYGYGEWMDTELPRLLEDALR